MSLSMMLAMVVLLLLSVFLPSAMDSKRSEKRVWHIITTSNCNNKHKCCTTVVHYTVSLLLHTTEYDTILHTTQYDPILHSIQYPRILNTKYYTVSPILHIAESLPPPIVHTSHYSKYTVFPILHTTQYFLSYTLLSTAPSYTLHSIPFHILHTTQYTVSHIFHCTLHPTQFPTAYTVSPILP